MALIENSDGPIARANRLAAEKQATSAGLCECPPGLCGGLMPGSSRGCRNVFAPVTPEAGVGMGAPRALRRKDSTFAQPNDRVVFDHEGNKYAVSPFESEGAALSRQEGGDHYKSMAIQPFEYITRNGIGFAEGCVIKYVSRWKTKGGVEDLKKAKHFLELLIEAEAK